MINTSAGFSPSGEGGELTEGFADVIAHSVEKLRQPSGTGFEQSSDWHQGEDSSSSAPACGTSGPTDTNDGYPIRSGECDDGSDGHRWLGIYQMNDILHSEERTQTETIHDAGAMMSVAMKLLAEGGKNPYCVRETAAAGCSTSAYAAGFTPAREILMEVLFSYATSTTSWSELADYGIQAAFDLYAPCTGEGIPADRALFEQTAVNLAFTGIGYAKQGSYVSCP